MATHIQDSRSSAVATVRMKYEALASSLDERRRRLWAAAEAQALGRGGIGVVSVATGLARGTIRAGIRELEGREPEPAGGIRREGGGRKFLGDVDETLLTDLNSLIEPTARGDPQSPLRWTCKSLRNLASELAAMGHAISSPETVGKLLRDLDFSLQSTSKTDEGGSHPDRNAQFHHINEQARQFGEEGEPVISVDAKKKEQIGQFKNAGREWHPAGHPEQVKVHDFIDPSKGKAIPYGVYDPANNCAWVSVGIDHNTADFAINTILTWWRQMGSSTYPGAHRLLITADGGGSNSCRARMWKIGLQRLANETGLEITVCHFPPGTSKWNKIEHRLFSFITKNWRGRPLVTHETVVNLISNTKTQTGLRVEAGLDTQQYPLGVSVTDKELAAVNLLRGKFHGEWNYQVMPNK